MRPSEKAIVARRLAMVAYGLFGSRDYLVRRGEADRDSLATTTACSHRD
jgi:hypothetical protein